MVFVFGMKVVPEKTGNKQYMSKDQTGAINGFFVLLVFFRHFAQYNDLGGMYDDVFLCVNRHLNQMIVVPFLFYSGYGMMTGIMKKGRSYVTGVLTKRLPGLFLRFNLLLTGYLALRILSGKIPSVRNVLLSMIGWESLGNSNWYMFGVFTLYLLLFASFIWLPDYTNRIWLLAGCCVLSALTAAAVFVQMRMDRPYYTYNTLIMFSLGCFFAVLRGEIEVFLKKPFWYAGGFLLTAGLYIFFYRNRWNYGIEGYTLWAVAFMTLIVLFSFRTRIGNPVLKWLGEHVFPIYVLQRLPMIVLGGIPFMLENPIIYFICSLSATILLSVLYETVIYRFGALLVPENRR